MSNDKNKSASPHILPPLSYEDNALEPVIFTKPIGFHYGKHRKGYVDNVNKLVVAPEFSDLPRTKRS